MFISDAFISAFLNFFKKSIKWFVLFLKFVLLRAVFKGVECDLITKNIVFNKN